MASTGPRLPPRARATSGSGLLVVVVEVLLRVVRGAQVRTFELIGKIVVRYGVLDGSRLLHLFLERARDLGLALPARRLARGEESRGGRVVLVGAALGTRRLRFAEVVELGAAAITLELGTELRLSHLRSHSRRDKGPRCQAREASTRPL